MLPLCSGGARCWCTDHDGVATAEHSTFFPKSQSGLLAFERLLLLLEGDAPDQFLHAALSVEAVSPERAGVVSLDAAEADVALDLV
jgi:hypothetical protein